MPIPKTKKMSRAREIENFQNKKLMLTTEVFCIVNKIMTKIRILIKTSRVFIATLIVSFYRWLGASIKHLVLVKSLANIYTKS